MLIKTAFAVPALALFALAPCFAHSYGPPPRVTLAPGDNAKACTLCHSGTLDSGTGSVKILLQSGNVYVPGVRQRVTVTVSDAAQQRWGFELTARVSSAPETTQAGQLKSVDNFTQVICEDAGSEPCAGVSFIQHTSAGTRNGTKGGASFQFDWTPPATNAGPVTLYAAGNAANGDGSSAGDHIYTSSVQLTPVASQAPTIMTGGIVSAATLTAGPVAANSWLAIYGTNLAATTRAWQDTDFVDGAYPVSLDGVSVVLTAFGAPRRAYVGYVSPAQINVLLPSDTNSTTVQVQVKNPAGISAQTPVTVQANAPQLLTLDGRFVLAAHADGSIVGKSLPASAGETVTIYATGVGATSPALVPGQVPAQSNALVTLPQITIGGAAATVASGAVVAGSGGVYQVVARIPAGVAAGDVPVVLQVGTASSAAALITVSK